MARGELHVQLSVQYADDEKFEDVGRSARLLYVDALCLAKKLLNDGVLSRVQVHKLMYPETKRAAEKAAAELAATGLWSWDEARQVFVITGWLKRNKSRAQIDQDRRVAEETALQANHKRWHVGRGLRDPKCVYCTSDAGHGEAVSAEISEETSKNLPKFLGISEETSKNLPKFLEKDCIPADTDGSNRSPDHMTAAQNGSGTRSGGRQRSESTETETETETKNLRAKTTGSQRSPGEFPADQPPPPGQRGTRLPEGFEVSPVMKAWALEHAPVASRVDHDMFIDHWRGQTGQRAVKRDWEATWRNWMRRVQENRTRNGPRPATARATTDDRIADALDLGRRMQAEHDAQTARTARKELRA